jgi:hypothetical protein
MASCALKLHTTLNLLFSNLEDTWVKSGSKAKDRPAILDDKLPLQDWSVIAVFGKILAPFKVASKQLQGDGIAGKRSTSGSFDEYFPVVEMLLDHLEYAV